MNEKNPADHGLYDSFSDGNLPNHTPPAAPAAPAEQKHFGTHVAQQAVKVIWPDLSAPPAPALSDDQNPLVIKLRKRVRELKLYAVEQFTEGYNTGAREEAESRSEPAQQAPGAQVEGELDKFWCETCEGTGSVYQEHQAGCHVGGDFPCPDCDGNGYWTRPTPPAAPAAPAEHAQTLNKLLNDFARACTFGDDAFARMAASKAIHGHYASLASQTTAPALSEPDPLQGAATWLKQAVLKCDVSDLMDRLLIGYNRAGRLFDAAPNQTPAPAEQGLSDAEIKRIHDTEACLPDLVVFKEQWPEILRFARAIERALAASRTTPKDGAS